MSGSKLADDPPKPCQLRGYLDEPSATGEGWEADSQIQRALVTNREEKLNFKDARRMPKGRVWDQDAVVELQEYREAIDVAKLLKKNTRLNTQNAGPSTPPKPPARSKGKEKQPVIVLDHVVTVWDNRSSGGEVTGGDESESGVGSGSQCEQVEEEELLMEQMLSLQLQNEAGDAGEGPSIYPQRTMYGRVVKSLYRQQYTSPAPPQFMGDHYSMAMSKPILSLV